MKDSVPVINGFPIGTLVRLRNQPKDGVGCLAEIVGHGRQAWCVRLEDGTYYDIDGYDFTATETRN